jgi:hypothetical protein
MEKVLVGTNMLKMWAPGNVQPLAPEGVANKVMAGTDLILQVHYSNTTGEPQQDQSKFALHVASPDETIMKQTQGQLVVQPNLNIKAGDPESRHEAQYTTNRDITLYSAGVHMHLRGKSMGMWAKRPGDTDETTIVWVPNYDFGKPPPARPSPCGPCTTTRRKTPIIPIRRRTSTGACTARTRWPSPGTAIPWMTKRSTSRRNRSAISRTARRS